MTNDDLRALASHCAEHVTRFEGGDPKEYSSYIYRQLQQVRDDTLEKAANEAEGCVDIVDFHRLPGRLRTLKDV